MTNFPLDEETITKMNQAFDLVRASRGEPDKELDQYYVTKDTSIQRALLVDPESYNGKRIILIGDMDLTSLFIGMTSKPKDLAVLDIDRRIPEIVFKMKFDHKIRNIRYVNHDFRIRMIAVLKNQFDYVFLEPPMTKEGLELGLSRAVQSAKKDSVSKIFLSFDIEQEKENLIEFFIDKMNLEKVEIKENFNNYDFPTPLGKKKSDLYILNVKPDSEETIPNHYFGPTYYRESNKFPQPYKCKCGENCNIGKDEKFHAITDLEESGCIKCEYKGPFLFESSIEME
ncbi:MAG: bis-aminopropyl spermidine synthase family protein [Candidatus Heimdallarchaeota archaeon]|nr:bis-aminopropyl spermidine synthase family protein [Candidatus Heimdallarchaeota archaeon]MCK4770149.1 bis-aminopropyl spermidine synthase family protein [Candidatus Heimdallarchaeota archaeon]